MKLAIALLCATFSATATDLRITIYNQAGLKPDIVDAASDFLKRIFRQSGIDVQLRLGDPNSEEGHLFTYPNPPRPGQENQASCHARRDVALEIRDVPAHGVRSSILGIAQPLARKGLNTMVFSGRIQHAALRANRAFEAVLAHAIAHEIGHVMLRSSVHAKGGLMSSHWGDSEYGRLANGGLLFNRDESRKILSTLRGDGCFSVSSIPVETP